MSRFLCGLAAFAILFLLLATTSLADEEMVANPYYKFWAGSKPGDKAVHLEQTKLSGPEGKLVPGGVDEKRIAYKVVEVDKDRVVVEMVVTERDFLGYVQAAPTRHIFPAKFNKADLERILQLTDVKSGEEAVKFEDKEYKCKTLAGTVKGPDGEQIEFKLWLSDEVPGSIIKQVRKARQKGDVFAETSTTLKSYKKAD